MKVEQFSILRDTGWMQVKGYTLQKDGVDIGLHKEKYPCNSNVFWYVTELSTGMKIPYRYDTRKSAVGGLNAWIHKIKEILGKD